MYGPFSLTMWFVLVSHYFLSFAGACPDNCHGHGTCHANGICECENGWTGIDCSTGNSFLIFDLKFSSTWKLEVLWYFICSDFELFIGPKKICA